MPHPPDALPGTQYARDHRLRTASQAEPLTATALIICRLSIRTSRYTRPEAVAGTFCGADSSPKGWRHSSRRRPRIQRGHGVHLIQGDIREARLPPETAGVLATASLEMIPEQDALISNLNAQLSSTQGRLAVGGFRRPPDWPEWAVALGRTALALFGVTRAHEDIQPWKSVREHMDEIGFETALGGALYLIVARASPPRGEAVEVRIVGLPL